MPWDKLKDISAVFLRHASWCLAHCWQQQINIIQLPNSLRCVQLLRDAAIYAATKSLAQAILYATPWESVQCRTWDACYPGLARCYQHLISWWVFLAVWSICYNPMPLKQRSTIWTRLGFSKAAATLSLSFNCLFTAASDACDPGESWMSTCTAYLQAYILYILLNSPWRTTIIHNSCIELDQLMNL